MPLFEERGNVTARIQYGEEYPSVHCYDNRKDFEVEVVVSLLTLLPDSYGEPPIDLPTPAFLIEAVQFCIDNDAKLQVAWEQIRREDPSR